MSLKIPDILCVSKDNVASGEKALQYLCLFLWCPTILDLIRVVFFLKSPFLSEVHLYVIPFVITCLILFCLPKIISAVRISDVVTLLVLVGYYEWCFHLYPTRRSDLELYEELFIIQSLPFYVLGLIVKPYKFKRTFYVSSAFLIIYSFVFYSLMSGGSANRDMSNEQMYLAYLVLPHFFYVLWYTLTEFSYVSLALTLLGLFELISYGNRGSIVCFTAFIVLFALYSYEYLGRKRVIGIIVLSSIVFFFSNEIIITLQGFLSSLGFSTRFFDLLMEGEMFTNTSALARNEISDVIVQAIIDNDGIPAGFCADRSLLIDYDQLYSHNIFLEILLTFGYGIGGIILLLLVLLIIKSLKNVQKNEEFAFGAVLFCCSIIKLQISGTFLSEPMLYFFIGYCVNIVRNNKSRHHKLEVE